MTPDPHSHPDPDADPPSSRQPRRFPSYSYVPGKFPHPLRDPAGHSFHEPGPLEELEAAEWFDWQDCRPYLRGIELFNHGYYWEAHETWEAVWHAAGRRGATADFCKGLIKLAAAGVKAREGRPEGVARHAARAKQLFESLLEQTDASDRFMGLQLPHLVLQTDTLIDAPESVVDARDAAVVVVMPFQLQPS